MCIKTLCVSKHIMNQIITIYDLISVGHMINHEQF
jgi:hypothetical protein